MERQNAEMNEPEKPIPPHGGWRKLKSFQDEIQPFPDPQPSTLNHQPLRNPATNAGNFHQAIGQPVGSAACHVRPKAFYAALTPTSHPRTLAVAARKEPVSYAYEI